MNSQEEHAEIGRMYVELENARRRRGCLDNRTRELLQAIGEAEAVLKSPHGNADIISTYPTRQEVLKLVREIVKLDARIAELEAFFNRRR